MNNVTRFGKILRHVKLGAAVVGGVFIVQSTVTAQPAPVGFTDLIITEAAPEGIPVETATAVLEAYKGAAAKAGWKLAMDYEVAEVRPFFIPEGAATQVLLRNYKLEEYAVLFIMSDKPGVFQRMKKVDLDNYGGKSAFFPAGKLTISLIYEKGTLKPEMTLDRIRVLHDKPTNVFSLRMPKSIEELRSPLSKEFVEANRSSLTSEVETLCGQDDRVHSDDKRVGRLMPVGCSGWLIADNLALTAGHCVEAAMSILEFQVPTSLANGTTQPAHPNDQYPVIRATLKMEYSGIGHDWAVFEVGPNSNTGKLPGVQQGAHFKLSKNARPSKARVTGYGLDSRPPGTSGGGNSDNQTQQTENGAGQTPPLVTYSGDSSHDGSFFRYKVDTMGGNSGSPVIDDDTADRPAIAIHTNGGCESGGNHATAADNEDLRQAIKHFVHDLSTVYVDE